MEKQGPGEYQRLHRVTVEPTLSELGIHKVAAHRYQTMAALPEEEFAARVEQAREANRELTSKAFYLAGNT